MWQIPLIPPYGQELFFFFGDFFALDHGGLLQIARVAVGQLAVHAQVRGTVAPTGISGTENRPDGLTSLAPGQLAEGLRAICVLGDLAILQAGAESPQGTPFSARDVGVCESVGGPVARLASFLPIPNSARAEGISVFWAGAGLAGLINL